MRLRLRALRALSLCRRHLCRARTVHRHCRSGKGARRGMEKAQARRRGNRGTVQACTGSSDETGAPGERDGKEGRRGEEGRERRKLGGRVDRLGGLDGLDALAHRLERA